MEMFEQIELGVISASAAFIFFGTLFSILRQTRSKSHNEMPGTLYEDEDGVATEESMLRYSVWVQKILVLLGSAVGLTASLVAAIQTQLSTSRVVDVLEEWLIFVAWVIICVFCFYFLQSRASINTSYVTVLFDYPRHRTAA